MYFCTAADSNHYPVLLNLIGSIFKNNEKDLKQIAVFDLGLTPEQIDQLNTLDRVKIYEIEKVHPLIITPIHCNNGRWIKGLFSWKAVVIKQALEMFPYVLYLDSGTTILKPLNGLFNHIKEHNYFLTDCGHSIKWMTPGYIIKKLKLDTPDKQWILDDNTFGIDAGFQGVSQIMKENYINPLYELSKEIRNFIDDGNCPNGLGTGRHDQTLFSIIVQELKLNILNHDRTPEECILSYSGISEPFHITHAASKVKENTIVFRSRRTISQETFNHNTSFIQKR